MFGLCLIIMKKCVKYIEITFQKALRQQMMNKWLKEIIREDCKRHLCYCQMIRPNVQKGLRCLINSLWSHVLYPFFFPVYFFCTCFSKKKLLSLSRFYLSFQKVLTLTKSRTCRTFEDRGESMLLHCEMCAAMEFLY